jgi:hypothetical protein
MLVFAIDPVESESRISERMREPLKYQVITGL